MDSKQILEEYMDKKLPNDLFQTYHANIINILDLLEFTIKRVAEVSKNCQVNLSCLDKVEGK